VSCGCGRWETVADDLSGVVNVAKVDATAESATATRCNFLIPQTPHLFSRYTIASPLFSVSPALSLVSIAGFPTLLYLSRGELWEYKGSRGREDLVRFASERQQRGGRRPSAEAIGEGEEGEEVDEDEVGELRGRPIPPMPSTWGLTKAAFLGFSARLNDVLVGQMDVAAVLLLMGALLGVVLTLIGLTLSLDRQPPPPYRPIPSAVAKGGGVDASKVVKGE
jgi:hypothetical protein